MNKELSNIDKFEKIVERRNLIIKVRNNKIKNDIKTYLYEVLIKLITLIVIFIITLIFSENNITHLINLVNIKLNYAYDILLYTTIFATLAILYTKKYNKQKNIFTIIIETSFNTGHVAISFLIGIAFYLLIFHKSKISTNENQISETFGILFFIWLFYITYIYLITKAFKR